MTLQQFTRIRARAIGVLGTVFVGLASVPLYAQNYGSESFGYAVAQVRRHTSLIVLSDTRGRASIAVWPAMQGRVLTSSASGANGRSFGWINQSLIASGKVQQHINAVGGEDRLWLGPEGGQFGIFFAKGAPFDLDHWYTPASIDTEPFDIIRQSNTTVDFTKSFELTNYAGSHFIVHIDREVKLLSQSEVWADLKVDPVAGVKVVGFESVNRLTNDSGNDWTKSTGALSLWVLGQFNASQHTTIVMPIRNGSVADLGIPVTRDYFGTVPDDRIKIEPNAIFFKGDANFRSKLGLSPKRATGVSGSYDPDHHVLTIIQYTMPTHTELYVNSAWKIQKHPFEGDVANCYNDGPPAPGKPQLGHFYELESSSPAAFLAPHDSISHTHRTIHLVGAEKELDSIAKASLGVSLEQVNAAFQQ